MYIKLAFYKLLRNRRKKGTDLKNNGAKMMVTAVALTLKNQRKVLDVCCVFSDYLCCSEIIKKCCVTSSTMLCDFRKT